MGVNVNNPFQFFSNNATPIFTTYFLSVIKYYTKIPTRTFFAEHFIAHSSD